MFLNKYGLNVTSILGRVNVTGGAVAFEVELGD